MLDKNDVAPFWAPGPWIFDVSEEAPPGTVVTILKAQDPDTIGSLRYTIVSPSQKSVIDEEDQSANDVEGTEVERQFRLDAVTGQLRLAEALDRETKEKYIVRVRADDGIQHTDINLIVQVR